MPELKNTTIPDNKVFLEGLSLKDFKLFTVATKEALTSKTNNLDTTIKEFTKKLVKNMEVMHLHK